MQEFPTIASLHLAYADGLEPFEVVAECYRRLKSISDPGIFLTLVPEAEAIQVADALDAFDPVAKPLWGVPFAVKDNLDVAGLPTTAACPSFSFVPEHTAAAIVRLVRAGAILIGKTNLDQFATGLVGVRTPHPPPRNALDPTYVPGGSSSGSAVAVSHGIVTFALGTDTAGSGRIPAGLNNIVGLKPSLGAVSSRGMLPACRTLDTISIFAGVVDDADKVFRVMAGFDLADPWSRDLAIPSQPGGLPEGLRVGVPDGVSRRFDGDQLAEAAFGASLRDLAYLVGPSAEIDLSPMFSVADLLYQGPWVAERYQAVRSIIQTDPEALHPTTRAVIGSATTYSAADAFAGRYRLEELRRAADAIWDRIDVLAVPTYPRPVSCKEIAEDPIGPNNLLGTYTNFVNLLDLCALSVPGRFREDGLPAGVTLIAPRGRDGLLAALGSRLHARSETTIGASRQPVPVPEAGSSYPLSNEVEIVVVGAHLSGLPLNHELTRRGGRFLRAVATYPGYRLFALPGGPPLRPGLIRCEPEKGASIETEVWALPLAGFADFVAGIPAPLCIGTLTLADGRSAKGFLVESTAAAIAEDITQFGGWRAYLASDRTKGRDSALPAVSRPTFARPTIAADA